MMISQVRTTVLIAPLVVPLLIARQGNSQQCVGDENGDNLVTISEVVTAVNNGLKGCGFSTGLVEIVGALAVQGDDTFRVWAVGNSGRMYATETRPGGDFTLLVPPDDSYVMGFGHFDGPGEMHFAGPMVFPCGDIEADHFFVGSDNRHIDLGMMALRDDGSFVRPQHGPLGQMDHDGDGVPDVDDDDIDCEDIGDGNHDGYYDDDMDHDGYHDDDMNRDGHHDGDEGPGHGMGHHNRP